VDGDAPLEEILIVSLPLTAEAKFWFGKELRGWLPWRVLTDSEAFEARRP